MTDVLDALKECVGDTYHPLLLPLLIFEVECMAGTELIQRRARGRVRSIENHLRLEFENATGGSNNLAELRTELLRRDIVECHAQALWRAPRDYVRILQTFRACLGRMDPEIHRNLPNGKGMAETQRTFASRVDLLEQRFENMSTYVDTTLRRLSMQQDAVSPALILRKFCIADISSQLDTVHGAAAY